MPISGQRDYASFSRWKLKRSPIPANSSHPHIASMWSSCPGLGCSGRIGNCLSHWDIRRARGLAGPIFRPMRPGFLPWFVTEEEARALAECIRAVIVVCAAVTSQESVKFWELADTYPMVTRMEGSEPRYHVEMFHSILPPEPPVALARLAEETLLAIRGQDYAVRGVMELDLTYSGASIGKRGERNACASIAIAVDAESGMVLAPEVTDSSVSAGDTLAKVSFKAIQPSRTMPKEVRVRKQKFKDSLAPLMESLGVTVRWQAGSRRQTKLGPICSTSFVGILAADRTRPPRSEPQKCGTATFKPYGNGDRESADRSICPALVLQ